jgi:hypothetical protein
MSETKDSDGESNRYEDVDGVYVDEDGNPRAEVEALSKGGESDEDARGH